MDRQQFCRQSRVLVVAGKGGVGKTSVTAALARMAADAGLEVLVVGLDDAGTLPVLFGAGVAFGYDEVVLYEATAGRVRGRVITPDDALLEYLMDHGLGRVAKRLVAAGVLDVVATAIPGIREILVLGKVKQLERAGDADLVVLDAPATGHAVRFLTSASGLLDAARGGPLRTQAAEVVEMLHDSERCQVLLVTLPEETPVNELIETAYRLEDEVGIMLGPVLVNACYPVTGFSGVVPETVVALAEAAGGAAIGPGEASGLAEAAQFRACREQLQTEQLARLSEQMPLPQMQLPFLFTAELSSRQLGELTRALGEAVDRLEAPTVGELGRQVAADGEATGEPAAGEPAVDEEATGKPAADEAGTGERAEEAGTAERAVEEPAP